MLHRQLGNGVQVILAARYNGNDNEYYAMTAQTSGKPTGVLFNSVPGNIGETVPSSIADEASTYYWTVTNDGTNFTFTNANGDVLGYTSSTNFATGGDNTAWTIEGATSAATAMVPEYYGFVISNVNDANAIAAKVSIMRLTQSICVTFSGFSVPKKAPTRTTTHATTFTVNWKSIKRWIFL